jgi:hypothetical protein
MLKHRIKLYIEKDGDIGPEIATVEGGESDALRLYQFLHGLPVSTKDGQPTAMKWIVTAEVRKPEVWEPVELG